MTIDYVLSCSGPGGNDSDMISVSKIAVPDATLEVRVNSGDWGSDNVAIAEGDEVSLRWESEHTSSCSGTNFVASSTLGTDTDVTEPTLGNQLNTLSLAPAPVAV